MGYFIQPILTDKASSETALAIQNREPLVFTRIALGSGRHRTDIGKKNNVVQVVHSLQVAQSLSTDVADTIRLTARFDNSQIDREIIVNEIGVFAKRGNHEEFMYMYTWAEQGDVIPPKTSAYVYRDYDFNTTISKNSQITIQYNATNLVYATVPELKATERKLQTNIDNHIGDTARHVSDQERTRWNGKADATHRHKVSDIEGLEAIIGNQTTNKANQADLNAHIQNQNNPHNVTKQQVGLGNVTNVEQASKQDFQHHLENHNNPHGVTKTQVGLGNVVNVEQASKSEFNSHSQNSTIHVSSVDKNRWNNAQLIKLTNDNGSAKTAAGNWDSYVESGMYTGAGLTNSPKGSRSPLYVTVTKIDGQNVMQQVVDNMNTFTAVRTKVNGVWGSWQVLPRLDMKVIPIQFIPGILPSKLATEEMNKIYVIGNWISLIAVIDKDSINKSKTTIEYSIKSLFKLPKEYAFSNRNPYNIHKVGYESFGEDHIYDFLESNFNGKAQYKEGKYYRNQEIVGCSASYQEETRDLIITGSWLKPK